MKEPIISIGISTGKEIQFELYGEFTLRENGTKISGVITAKAAGAFISLFRDSGEIFTGREILITPYDFESESFLLRDVVIGKNFHWQKKEDQRFRGTLKLIREKGKITAVNILPLEEYLRSVISSEMSPNSSSEFLKAHAVVSRGWLLAQLEKKNRKAVSEFVSETEIIRWYDREDHNGFDFCADDHCQRYQGVTKINNETASYAISATRGLALTYNGRICDTRYSKCCGGMTESFENVWEPEIHPYLQSVSDSKFEPNGDEFDLRDERSFAKWIEANPNAFCNTSDRKILSQILVDFDLSTDDFFRWRVEYTQDELAEIIRLKSGIDFGVITDLIPVERGYSGRIIKLKITGSQKTMTVGKELEIRKILSNTHLLSSAFTIKKENISPGYPQKFVLDGAGWGHGVGLCQIGAAVMGEIGYNFDEILTHYFPKTIIQKIY
jgi:stage II sporulation protein D